MPDFFCRCREPNIPSPTRETALGGRGGNSQVVVDAELLHIAFVIDATCDVLSIIIAPRVPRISFDDSLTIARTIFNIIRAIIRALTRIISQGGASTHHHPLSFPWRAKSPFA